jgi:hypothetical protein
MADEEIGKLVLSSLSILLKIIFENNEMNFEKHPFVCACFNSLLDPFLYRKNCTAKIHNKISKNKRRQK